MPNFFFQWLVNNPWILALVIIVICMVVIIYAIAFFEGRSIIFWPPRIGKRPEKQNTDKKAADDEVVSLFSPSAEKTRKITEAERERALSFNLEPPTTPMRYQGKSMFGSLKPFALIELSTEPVALFACTKGEVQGSWIFIAADAKEIHIGRGKQVDITIDGEYISRDHLMINVDISKGVDAFLIEITDLNSENGTFVNGIRLQPHHAINLNDGDKIEIGFSTFEFRLLARQI